MKRASCKSVANLILGTKGVKQRQVLTTTEGLCNGRREGMLGHGSGGSMMKRIIDEVFFEAYGTDELLRGDDAAVLAGLAPGERLAYSRKLRGDTAFLPRRHRPFGCVRHVNDVATSGARPLYLSCAFIWKRAIHG